MGFVRIAFAGFLSLPLLSAHVTVAADGEPLRADVVVNDGAATFSPSSNWLRSKEGVKSLMGNPVPQHLATVQGVDFSPADRWSMLWNPEGNQVWSAFRTDATQPMLTLPARWQVKFAAGDSTLVGLEPAGPDDAQRIHTVRVWTLDVAEQQWTESASFSCSAQPVRSYEDPNVWGSIADMVRRRVVAEVTDRWLIFSTNENELQLCDLARRPPPLKVITLAGDVQSWTLIRGWLIASTLSGMRYWHLGADDPAATERGFSCSPCSLQESEIGDDGSWILYRRDHHFEHYSTKTKRLTRLNVRTPLRIGNAANNVKRYVECSKTTSGCS